MSSNLTRLANTKGEGMVLTKRQFVEVMKDPEAEVSIQTINNEPFLPTHVANIITGGHTFTYVYNKGKEIWEIIMIQHASVAQGN